MDMNGTKLIFKGGYGEHGRSCFLVSYHAGYIMVDCGIMDTDCNPYPNVDEALMKQVNYIFITHCHKDHAAALPHFMRLGFCGTVITSKATYELANMDYENVILLQEHCGTEALCDDISFDFGSSGHCAGGLWFSLRIEKLEYFFSGDYQEDTLVYVCDHYRGKADFAIIDCAHKGTGEAAARRREKFLCAVKEELSKGKRVVLPVQKYGRGVELYFQIKSLMENVSVKCDDDFYTNTMAIFKYSQYFKEGTIELLTDALHKDISENQWDILIIGESHIEKQSNRDYLSSMLEDLTIISTGRMKSGGILSKWQQEGYVIVKPYSHHQSEIDMQKLIAKNHFKLVFPFHNSEQEVVFTSELSSK